MKRRTFLQGAGSALTLGFLGINSRASSSESISKINAFSILDAFETSVQRDAIKHGNAIFDAAVYINEGLDYAARKGYSIVYFPSGTYPLGGVRLGPYAAIIAAHSNMTMLGDGITSILRVFDNYTIGGDYRIVAPITEDEIVNFSLRGMHFDGNGLRNTVLGSSGKDVRRAYAVNILKGRNIEVSQCWFRNMPGRSVINLGNNTSPPSISGAIINGNVIANVGGSIEGNRQQNDHSSIYLQADGGVVTANQFSNDKPVDPFTKPAIAVVALEIHGRNTLVFGNKVNRYGTGGNAVASSHDSENNLWQGNSFENITSLGLTLWSLFPYQNRGLRIVDNSFHIDNSVYSGNTAIFQNPLPGATTSRIKNLFIEGNYINSDVTEPRNATWHGISLCALDGAVIRGNKIRNIQGCGINIEKSVAHLGVNDVDIYSNEIVSAGLHKGVNRVWGIRISNDGNDQDFSHINIHGNRLVAGASRRGMRGILIEGGPRLKSVVVGEDNQFLDIPVDRSLEKRRGK